MKKIIEWKLKLIAKMLIGRHKPEIIGVTGSVGKTTTKEAIYIVLEKKGLVRRNEKNYNNELGLPLTVIGAGSPGKSIWGWLVVLWKGILLALGSGAHYPKTLVLEMGADKPGDIDYLLKIAKPRIGVITKISNSHLEAFKTLEAIKNEKAKLVRCLDMNDWAVLNADDDVSMSLRDTLRAKIITFGLENKADVSASEFMLSFRDVDGFEGGDPVAVSGLNFKIRYQGSVVPVLLPGTIGLNAVYAALSAAAVGVIHGMNLVEIAQALRRYDPPNGRMRPIEGIKRTLIVDDTYNSSPASSDLALKMLARIPDGRNSIKYAVFGNMLELGPESEEGHLRVGRATFDQGVDFLVTVGELAKDIARGAQEAGMEEDRIARFDGTDEAGRFLQEKIKRGDILLIKGSQGARMEKIVKEIMARPDRAGDLLVRQGKEWENR